MALEPKAGVVELPKPGVEPNAGVVVDDAPNGEGVEPNGAGVVEDDPKAGVEVELPNPGVEPNAGVVVDVAPNGEGVAAAEAPKAGAGVVPAPKDGEVEVVDPKAGVVVEAAPKGAVDAEGVAPKVNDGADDDEDPNAGVAAVDPNAGAGVEAALGAAPKTKVSELEVDGAAATGAPKGKVEVVAGVDVVAAPKVKPLALAGFSCSML